jgi:hypothetical protein
MSDGLDGVRDHYRATGLTKRLKTALTAFGPKKQRLTPQQLAALDQFHTRGLANRRACEVGRDYRRYVGSGCRIGRWRAGALSGRDLRLPGYGVDLSETFVNAARYLTEYTGQSGQVSFETANPVLTLLARIGSLPFG